MPEFMISLRKADGTDGLGPVRYLWFDTVDGPEADLTQDDWVRRIVTRFNPSSAPAKPRMSFGRTGEILFLVHGFNVKHQAAKAFHVQCAKALSSSGWKGQLVSYDWPSDGLVFAYLPDRANARHAASTLVTSAISMLHAAQQDDCTVDVHVMAHSMGAFVVQQAFAWAYQDVPPDWSVGQVLLVAGDVDYTVFSAGAPSANAFVRYAGRLTNYRNRYDKALVVSNAKRLELAPRVGRVGLPADAPVMMCDTDCSELFEKTFPNPAVSLDPQPTHCFYFDRVEFWRDVVLTLAGGVDRSVIATRKIDAAATVERRFILNPAGISDADYQTALARASITPTVEPS